MNKQYTIEIHQTNQCTDNCERAMVFTTSKLGVYDCILHLIESITDGRNFDKPAYSTIARQLKVIVDAGKMLSYNIAGYDQYKLYIYQLHKDEQASISSFVVIHKHI